MELLLDSRLYEGWDCLLLLIPQYLMLYLAHIGAQYIVDEPINYGFS
jgi:hypothetical protein